MDIDILNDKIEILRKEITHVYVLAYLNLIATSFVLWKLY